MTQLPLFDPIPLYCGPALYTEPQFAFLNRAEGPEWAKIRDLLEDWYSRYPDRDGGLRERFRKNSIDQHAGAWWELYTHELFSRLGCSLTVEPEIPGSSKRPDFLVRRGDSEFLVECAVLFEDGRTKRCDSDQWLLDCIDAARNPDFMVDVRINSGGSRRLKKSRIARDVETWLATLDYEAAYQAMNDRAPLPYHLFNFGDDRLQVKLTALPVKPDRRGLDGGRLGIGPGGSAFPITSTEEIRTILKDKRKQCVAEGTPAVIAILDRTTLATDREVAEALFGSAVIRHNGQSAWMVRAEDGYCNPGPPPRGGGVSAVLFGDGISMSRPMGPLPTLWLNPWSRSELPKTLPFRTKTARDTGEVFEYAEATVSSESVFGFPPGWPWADFSDR